VVIAVDLNSDILGRHLRRAVSEPLEENEVSWTQRVLGRFGVSPETLALDTEEAPSLLTVLATSINIMQVRIGRSRMAGDPADVLIAPRLAHLGLMDFHRGEEGIAEGRAAVERSLPAILHALGREA
jgi:NTE family protein